MITFMLAVCGNVDYVYSFPQSPPSRAAWIEISSHAWTLTRTAGRRLHGRRGLKFCRFYLCFFRHGRRLHGRRGLKSAKKRTQSSTAQSPPSRAAWIEIWWEANRYTPSPSPPSRAAWIEIHGCVSTAYLRASPPSRAAWIEMRVRLSCVDAQTCRRLHGRRGLKSF